MSFLSIFLRKFSCSITRNGWYIFSSLPIDHFFEGAIRPVQFPNAVQQDNQVITKLLYLNINFHEYATLYTILKAYCTLLHDIRLFQKGVIQAYMRLLVCCTSLVRDSLVDVARNDLGSHE